MSDIEQHLTKLQAERMNNVLRWAQNIPMPPPVNVEKITMRLQFNDGSTAEVELIWVPN